MRRIRLFGTIVGSIIVGVVTGPLLIAVVGAAFRPSTNDFESNEVSRLIDAYQDNLPPHRLFMTIPPEDGTECGYDPNEIFPDSIDEMIQARQQRKYADYEGYYALDRWRSEQRDEDWIFAVAERMTERMSPFEAGFLRRCIESTLFADACMKRVEKFGDVVPRSDPNRPAYQLASGYEDQVVCTFIDGVAIRRGVELQSPDKKAR